MPDTPTLTVVEALATSVELAGSAYSDAGADTFYTDFNEYTTGVQPSGTSRAWYDDHGTFDVGESVDFTGGKALVFTSGSAPSSADHALALVSQVGDADLTDGAVEIVARLRRRQSGGFFALNLCMNAADLTQEQAYTAEFNGTTTFRIAERTSAGAMTGIQSVAFTNSVDVFYWVCLQVSLSAGTVTYKGKAWAGDPEDEPLTGGPDGDGFQVKGTDASPRTTGYVGVSADPGTVAGRIFEWDLIGVGTAGTPAPRIAPHKASRWQVAPAENTVFVPATYDSGEAGEAELTEKTVTDLTRGTDYIARVQYQNQDDEWSAWSEPVAFTTLGRPAGYALWASGAFYTALDVLIERAEGPYTVMQSYRDFGGRNWIKSLRLERPSVQQPIGSGVLTLHRQVGSDSLAPLMTQSALNQDGGQYAPALDFGREIEIRTALIPTGVIVSTTAAASVGATTLAVEALPRAFGEGSAVRFARGAVARLTAEATAGATSLTVAALNLAVADGETGVASIEPVSADWEVHFQGITDDIDWPQKAGDITVPFRDRSGVLADTFIRNETRYGDQHAPEDAADVMQEILDDHAGAGQYTLDDLVTGARFAVTRYVVRDISVWQALESLALQWGGKALRQEWNESAEEFRVAVIETPRDQTDAEWSVPASVYLEVHQTGTGGKRLRTVVRGHAVDSETGETLTSQVPEEHDLFSDPLVDAYGVRYLGFSEDDTSAIDTQAELDDMVQAAYEDVSSVIYPLETETRFAPRSLAGVDSVLAWGANALLWDVAQTAAVMSLADDFPAPGVARTRWRLADRPKATLEGWLRRAPEIAGLGQRPTIFALDLAHSPSGTLVASVQFNDFVAWWEIWSRLGASPKTDGVPDAGYSKGEYYPEQRTASWSVSDGVHHVVVRAYAGADRSRFSELSDEITVTGTGTGGGGGGSAPTEVPSTPWLDVLGASAGNQAVVANWFNVTAVHALEAEWWVDDAIDTTNSLAAGDESDTEIYAYAPNPRVKMRVRYTAGAGLEGPWSPFSAEITLDGSF